MDLEANRINKKKKIRPNVCFPVYLFLGWRAILHLFDKNESR